MDPVQPAPAQPAPQPQPITPPETPKPKLLLWVLGGVLLLAAGTAGGMVWSKQIYYKPSLQLAPSPSPSGLLPMVTKNNETLTPELAKQILPLVDTANWKTYESKSYKFSFKWF